MDVTSFFFFIGFQNKEIQLSKAFIFKEEIWFDFNKVNVFLCTEFLTKH